MPYNYLLSAHIREAHEIKLKDTIIIIDEAHNINQAAEDIVEMELTSKDLHDMIHRELLYLLKKIDPKSYNE